ncbi:antitoxin [Cyclobacterium jeungdonense]|uniref:Type II toxin-antitoxin system VapB family antitoxin n=1 Tax=Cyclobacterium jeungdonense TaxID=708087 RepID=A0ABT8CFP7_9BACT|nr:type II toxin-antitoxin system VapB family antitoxin [Cyclobacterium jeungdonense]MDN3690496.1 type II toxin-antitoxin system VapB family antitoxin [Cyclobacterium jeungdonense]
MEKTAKVFKSGNSQALRLPKEFNTDEKQFYIRRIGASLLLSPKASSWEMVVQSLTAFSDDYFEEGRNQLLPQQRETL